MQRSVIALSLIAAVFLAQAACVSSGTYDAAVADAKVARASAASERAQRMALDRKLVSETRRADELQEKLASTDKKLEGARTDLAAIEAQLAAAERQLSDAEKGLANQQAALTEQKTASQAQLDQLRREKAAVESRAALFRELARKLARMIDTGNLRIVLRDGRMVLQLPNDVVFDSGSTVIKPAGRAALEQIADVLKTVGGHEFQIAGNTDDVPIMTGQFPSNWELSAARALGVVHFLVGRGMPPSALSAAGYGEFDPIAPNDSEAGRAKNRRTEIVVQPNIDEMVAFPSP